jgi:hypothetical protein
MITFDPPASIMTLSNVAPGSLVRWDAGAVNTGFCVIRANDPTKSLVSYDQQAQRFHYRHRDNPTVISYGNDVIVHPEPASFQPELTVAVDGTLYILEEVPHLMVAVGNDFRFLNLVSGEIYSRSSWPMMAGFRSWSAGVRRTNNEFIKLLCIVPRTPEGDTNHESPEPEVV